MAQVKRGQQMLRRLGDLLVVEGLITDGQLRQALTEQKGKTDKLGTILVSLGFITEELGDVLFSLVNVARLSSLDAEDVLQRAIEKFRRRFTTMEADLNARGTSVGSVSPEELERSREAVKAQERTR